MNLFFAGFSNRELSLIIWFSIFLVFVLLNQKIRNSIKDIFKVLLSKKIALVILSVALYTSVLVYFLWFFKLWNQSLLKDTLFWFISVAFILLLNINKVKRSSYFKKIAGDLFKWTAIAEFLMNFYTFSLTTELILMPLLVLTGAVLAFAKTKKKYDPVSKLLSNFLTLLGIVFVVFIIYKTINFYKDLFTVDTLRSFILTPILTLAYLPLLYLIALLTKYEDFFITLEIITDRKRCQLIKKQVFRIANFNISKLVSIQSNFKKRELNEAEDLTSYLKKISLIRKTKPQEEC